MEPIIFVFADLYLCAGKQTKGQLKRVVWVETTRCRTDPFKVLFELERSTSSRTNTASNTLQALVSSQRNKALHAGRWKSDEMECSAVSAKLDL